MKTFLTIVTLLGAAAFNSRAADTTTKPNLIFILSDDVGLGDVSCSGGDKFKTPQIDALAKSGLRFEHCYAAPLCGPSRAEILTGRYAFRTGMTGNDSGPVMKPANEIMIPKVLKPAGYVTGMVGKWNELPLQPSDWGFDEYLRFQGSGLYWRSQRKFYNVNGQRKELPEGKYLPDLMHEFLVDFITRHRDQPFYVHYAMSHIYGQILLTPDSAPNSKDLYADNIAYMDKLVGQLIAELDRLKLREKTLVIFVGDNGTARLAADRVTVNGRAISGHKGEMLEGGSRVPMIASWPGTTPAGKVSHDLTDFSDFLPTFAELAGAKLPQGVAIDGHSFAAQLRGQAGQPREWIFVELGRKWYARERDWKLTHQGELYDMKQAPFEEKLVSADAQGASVLAARKRLQTVLDKLTPASGKTDLGDGSGRHDRKKKKARV